MAKPVVMKAGQFLLLVFAVFMVGAGAGVMGAGLVWHKPQAAGWASLMQVVGLAAFIVMSIWKSVDDWTERTSPPQSK